MSRQALRLGVVGWVRNRTDGSVEAIVAGPAAAVEAMVEWARQGPDAALVLAVDVQPARGRFEGFEQRPTV